MSRNTMPIIYGVLAVFAIGLGLFVANIFGNQVPNITSPNSVASASARTSTPSPSAAPTQASQATSAPTTAATATRTSAPTTAATAAATSVTETSAPTAAATAAAPTADTTEPTTTAPTAQTTESPAATAPAITEQPTAAAAYVEYTVQAGDSLKVIAQQYNVTLQQILAINDIPNPDVLTIGSVIKIPTS